MNVGGENMLAGTTAETYISPDDREPEGLIETLSDPSNITQLINLDSSNWTNAILTVLQYAIQFERNYFWTTAVWCD